MKYLLPIGVGCLVVGLLLVVGSVTWRQALPNDAVWSQEQATSLSQAAGKFHKDTFDESIDKVSLEQSRIAWQQQQDQLDRALSVKNSVPLYLRVSGIAILGAAVSLILVHHHNQQN